MIPSFDLPLFLAAGVAALLLGLLHLALRPELRGGRKLSRLQSYVLGLGVVLGALLLLELARGAMCQCWMISVFQLWLDAPVIAVAGALPVVLLRLIYGEPLRGNPQRDLAEIERMAEEITRHATSNSSS
jgi:hypothetical protein